MSNAYRIEQAVAALQGARARLLAEDPSIADDDQMLADMLEGDIQAGDEMNVIDRVIRQSIEQDRLAKDAEEYIKQIKERGERFKRRRDSLRALAFAAMDALGLPKLTRGDFTASVRAGSPSVVITNEDVLPKQYVRTKLEPNKQAIAEAIKAGATVPGAQMSNGVPTLQVRTR